MRKIGIIYSVISLGFLCLFVSCSRDYPIHEEDRLFPLSVRNEWQYEREWTLEIFPSQKDLTRTTRIFWKIIDRDRLRGRYNTHILQEIEVSEERETWVSFNWYAEDWEGQEGLYHIAYARAGPRPPKLTSPYKIKFAGKEFNSPEEIFDYVRGIRCVKSDTIIRIPPRKVFVYPLYIGKEWVAFDDIWLQTRRVIGMETITTPAGEFLCYKIQVSGEMWDENAVWYDWFSKEGLVKRYFWWRGEARDEHGDIIGTIESTDIRLLVDYSVRY